MRICSVSSTSGWRISSKRRKTVTSSLCKNRRASIRPQ